MPMLHDRADRERIVARIRSLSPASTRRWGRMTADQMLWHVNQGFLAALGRLQTEKKRTPLPGFVMRALVLNLPWPKGAPTAPEFVARSTHEFSEQRDLCVQLVQDFAELPLAGDWPPHVAFGAMTGKDWSRLNFKHLDHHLRQFSA